MQKPKVALELRELIIALEAQQIEEGRQLKEQLRSTYESLKPLNVLKNLISDFGGPTDLKDNLVQTATGLITGYITRKILIRNSGNPFIRMTGVFLQYWVTNFVSNHAESIKNIVVKAIEKQIGKNRNTPR